MVDPNGREHQGPAEQKRPFTITGDELKYAFAVGSMGDSGTVVWRRVK